MHTTSLRKTQYLESSDHAHFQVFVRSQSVVSRRIAGETLIVPVRGKVGDLASIYSFNQTGSLIWQALETPQGLAALIGSIQQEYAVGYEQAEQDVKQFLNDTLSAGLVEIRAEVSIPAINSTSQGELQSAGSR
ncbi:MAG: PqqD family protein [Candidatus Sulfotelmatobacter sp.]|jgi:hypothetical protein